MKRNLGVNHLSNKSANNYVSRGLIIINAYREKQDKPGFETIKKAIGRIDILNTRTLNVLGHYDLKNGILSQQSIDDHDKDLSDLTILVIKIEQALKAAGQEHVLDPDQPDAVPSVELIKLVREFLTLLIQILKKLPGGV